MSARPIGSNNPHARFLHLRFVRNGSSRATRHLLIRARSASGLVARGGHVTSSGSQPNVCRRPARTFVLPAPRVPDGLTITRFLSEAADTRAPKSSCRITASASAFIAPCSMNSIGWCFAKRSTARIDELQADLDAWLADYNDHRPHQGRWCFGKTPMQTFLDTLPLAKEKLMAA
jgi:transposase InsO family protein